MTLDTVASAYGVGSGELQSVASVYRPDAAHRAGSVLLKPFRYGEAQLRAVTSALSHLGKVRFRRVPRLVLTLGGEPYVRLSGQLWYALSWIPGQPLQLPDDLLDAADSLARFHRAAQGCSLPYVPGRSWRRRWHRVYRDIGLFHQRASTGWSAFDQAYRQHAPAFMQRARVALQALDQIGYDALEAAVRQRSGFCHGDCTVSNLLMSESGFVVLVDPDTFGPDLRLGDLIHLIASGVSPDAERILRLLAGYEATSPLDSRERQLLPAALMVPREFWWAGLCRYRRPHVGVNPEALLARTLAEAELRDGCVHELARLLKAPIP